MKRLISILLVIALSAGIVVGVVSVPVIKNGYNLYADAVEKTPIEDKVAEIQSSTGYTPYKDISPLFIEKLVEEEDRRFFEHSGFDIISFTRAIIANLSSGRFSQGGSTLTQQLAKNMYFSFEKQMERKVAELLVAFQLEKLYSKEDILALYCTLAYFGENCYGIKQAAGFYYGVKPMDLNEEQARQLVETLKAPSIHNPSTMRR